MKKLRIGRRRARVAERSPLERALAPALEDGRWRVPDRFNFTRDVVEVLARDVKRRALTFVGSDGVIEPRTFHDLAEGANRWASILSAQRIGSGDRVLVLSGANVDWVEAVLGCIKAGAVVVPSPPDLSASALEARFAHTGASLVIAGGESKAEIAQMSFTPDVQHLFEGRRRRASDVADDQPTADTSSRDVAFLAWTAGTAGRRQAAAHTHGATFAARCAAEHWLQAGAGDVVWCTAPPDSLQTLGTIVFGAWARGAEVALHDGAFDALERLELLHRFGITVLCQSPSEYRALSGRRELTRYRSSRLRRLVATGDELDPEVVAAFEEAWGLTIANGYGQAETNVVVGHAAGDAPAGSLGRPLPGHHLAVVDGNGSELPPGVEGSLAIRGRPPTLFAGYWDAPEETRASFLGDWYLTGDVAVADEEGAFWFVSRVEDTITSRGRTFGPHEVERVLRTHQAVEDCAVVGIRDLERGGHFVRAFVVLAPGAEGSIEQLEAELRQFVGRSLVEQQVPREIEFIDAVPRSVSGAVSRNELRERPVAGRPLWELPPTFEPEIQPEPAPTLRVVPAAPETPLETPAVEESPKGLAALVEVEAPAQEAPPPPPPVPVEPEAPSEAPAAARPAPPPEPKPDPEPVLEVAPPEPEAAETPSAVPGPAPEADTRAVEPESEGDGSSAPVEPAESTEEDETHPVGIVEPDEPETGTEPVIAAVVEAPEPPTGAAATPPEPGPQLDPEPLPDFVVDPSRTEEQAPPPPPSPPAVPENDDEEEENLGPLPEYVVDPERRLQPVGETVPGRAAPDADVSPPSLFPPMPVLDLRGQAAARDADDDAARPSTRRPRPAPPSGKAKRSGSNVEPGDEAASETTWMKGLSSRLSAYSLDEDDAEQVAEDEERAPKDDAED